MVGKVFQARGSASFDSSTQQISNEKTDKDQRDVALVAESAIDKWKDARLQRLEDFTNQLWTKQSTGESRPMNLNTYYSSKDKKQAAQGATYEVNAGADWRHSDFINTDSTYDNRTKPEEEPPGRI